MSELTKNDVKKALEEVFDEKFDSKLAPFAIAIQKDFNDMRIEMREGFNKVNDDINYTHSHLSLIEEKLDKKADWEMVRSLDNKVLKLETKMQG